MISMGYASGVAFDRINLIVGPTRLNKLTFYTWSSRTKALVADKKVRLVACALDCLEDPTLSLQLDRDQRCLAVRQFVTFSRAQATPDRFKWEERTLKALVVHYAASLADEKQPRTKDELAAYIAHYAGRAFSDMLLYPPTVEVSGRATSGASEEYVDTSVAIAGVAQRPLGSACLVVAGADDRS